MKTQHQSEKRTKHSNDGKLDEHEYRNYAEKKKKKKRKTSKIYSQTFKKLLGMLKDILLNINLRKNENIYYYVKIFF